MSSVVPALKEYFAMLNELSYELRRLKIAIPSWEWSLWMEGNTWAGTMASAGELSVEELRQRTEDVFWVMNNLWTERKHRETMFDELAIVATEKKRERDMRRTTELVIYGCTGKIVEWV